MPPRACASLKLKCRLARSPAMAADGAPAAAAVACALFVWPRPPPSAGVASADGRFRRSRRRGRLGRPDRRGASFCRSHDGKSASPARPAAGGRHLCATAELRLRSPCRSGSVRASRPGQLMRRRWARCCPHALRARPCASATDSVHACGCRLLASVLRFWVLLRASARMLVHGVCMCSEACRAPNVADGFPYPPRLRATWSWRRAVAAPSGASCGAKAKGRRQTTEVCVACVGGKQGG